MEKRNLSQITPQKIGTFLGYTIYVPDSHFNPIAYLKKGCPIWIQVNYEGDCLIHILQKDNVDNTEIVNFIKTVLKPKLGIACIPLSESVKEELKLSTNDDFGLNCMAQDCDNNIKAVITVDKKHTEEGDIMLISHVSYESIEALKELREYLFREENRRKYRGKVLWYKPSFRGDLTDTLSFLKDKNGMSYFQFE